MGIIAWIVLGAIAGWITNMIMGGGEGVIATIVLGIIGAIVGGFLAGTVLKVADVTGVNIESIVVAVEWQVRHGLYGKTERRTSKFMAHDEKSEAKVGDLVEIVETRPMSRRKRWALKRVVRQAAQV